MPHQAPSFILLGDSLVSNCKTFIDPGDYNIILPASVNAIFPEKNIEFIIAQFYANKSITVYDKLKALEDIGSVTCVNKVNYRSIFLDLDISSSYARQYCLDKLNGVAQMSAFSNKSWELLEHFIQPRSEINTRQFLAEILPHKYKEDIVWHRGLIEQETHQTLKVVHNIMLAPQQALTTNSEGGNLKVPPSDQIYYGLPCTVDINNQVLEERDGLFLSNFLDHLDQLHIAIKVDNSAGNYSTPKIDTLIYLEDAKPYKIVQDFFAANSNKIKVSDCTFPGDTNILIIGERYHCDDF